MSRVGSAKGCQSPAPHFYIQPNIIVLRVKNYNGLSIRPYLGPEPFNNLKGTSPVLAHGPKTPHKSRSIQTRPVHQPINTVYCSLWPVITTTITIFGSNKRAPASSPPLPTKGRVGSIQVSHGPKWIWAVTLFIFLAHAWDGAHLSWQKYLLDNPNPWF